MTYILSTSSARIHPPKKAPKSWLQKIAAIFFEPLPEAPVILSKTLVIIVRGKVQGVNFRKACYDKAMELGIGGTVENLADGTVQIIATGNQWQLKDIIDWSKVGPGTAYVTTIEDHELPHQTFETFKIIR